MPTVDDVTGDSEKTDTMDEVKTDKWLDEGETEGEDFEFDATEDEEGLLDKLWKDTADKDLSEYDNHPLNVTGREGNKRICRAVEGFGLDSSKAVVDLVIGTIQEMQEMGEKS